MSISISFTANQLIKLVKERISTAVQVLHSYYISHHNSKTANTKNKFR